MNKSKRLESPTAVAMMKRHGSTSTTMRDRRERRPKDARRSWKKEAWV